MSTPHIGVVSPDPLDTSQGLEKFCHMLRDALTARDLDAEVIGLDADTRPYDLIVTNGIFGPWRTSTRRLHVYHGTAPKQLAIDDPTISRRFRARSLVTKSSREFRAGLKADRVAVSPSVKHELRRYYRFDSEVVLNGVDTEVFAPTNRAEARRRLNLPTDERLALFVGRPESRKLPDYAIAAAQATGHRLLLAAGRDYDGMDWIGRLGQRELALAMSAVDVLYLPSQYEAMSLAVLEALAVGTPLVTTRVGWVPELIREVPQFAGYAPSHRSKALFVEAAKRHASDPASAQEATSAARELVRTTLNLDCFADAWTRKILDLVSVPGT